MTRPWWLDEQRRPICHVPGKETSKATRTRTGAADYARAMSVPPEDGRRPLLAAVSIVVIIAFVVFFIAVL